MRGYRRSDYSISNNLSSAIDFYPGKEEIAPRHRGSTIARKERAETRREVRRGHENKGCLHRRRRCLVSIRRQVRAALVIGPVAVFASRPWLVTEDNLLGKVPSLAA